MSVRKQDRTASLHAQAAVGGAEPMVDAFFRDVAFAHTIGPGPSDSLLVVVSGPTLPPLDPDVLPEPAHVLPDGAHAASGGGSMEVGSEPGDFVRFRQAARLCPEDEAEHDCVQAYGTVRLVLDMYLRDLQTESFLWQWEAAGDIRYPLRLYVHTPSDDYPRESRLCYMRGQRVIVLGRMASADGEELVAARCFDLVAHEAGHAVLDALRSELYSHRRGQLGAIHEAFGDATVLFAVLAQLDMCDLVVAGSGAELRSPEAAWLTAIAEDYARLRQAAPPPAPDAHAADAPAPEAGVDADGHPMEGEPLLGFRQMDNRFVGDGMFGPEELGEAEFMYVLSSVLLGFIFDVVEAAFLHGRNPRVMVDAEALLRTSRVVRRLFILAISTFPSHPDGSDDAIRMPPFFAIASIMAERAPDVCRDAGLGRELGVVVGQEIMAMARKRGLRVAGLSAEDRAKQEALINPR